MRALLPKSLAGQLAAVMAGALLVASLVNFVLLLGERHRAAQIEQTSGPIARFADIAAHVIAVTPVRNGQLVFERSRRSRYMVEASSTVTALSLHRDLGIEARLKADMIQNGVEDPVVLGSVRTVEGVDEIGRQLASRIAENPAPARSPLGGRPNDSFRWTGEPAVELVLSTRLPDGRWLTSLTHQPEPTRGDAFLVGASTLITFVFVLGAALWIAGKLSRPLRDVATAAGQVGDGDDPQQVEARGPGDVQQTIHAFNAMSRRVTQLLKEKDVMLGALGHDLRTPLASLRIRLETMEPESERLKAVRTIEETSALLDDILELSRRGKSREPERTMDVSVLLQDVVEDYAETGAQISLVSSQRAVAACRPVLLRRALRNLIDNAITYGGGAEVVVESDEAQVCVHVDDNGPGMSPSTLATATEPFFRGESSRSRSTGGAGLGLTLADAIARAHGGSLVLRNRTPKGLRATICLPAVKSRASSSGGAFVRSVDPAN